MGFQLSSFNFSNDAALILGVNLSQRHQKCVSPEISKRNMLDE